MDREALTDVSQTSPPLIRHSVHVILGTQVSWRIVVARGEDKHKPLTASTSVLGHARDLASEVLVEQVAGARRNTKATVHDIGVARHVVKHIQHKYLDHQWSAITP